jgi:fatty acid desaturase
VSEIDARQAQLLVPDLFARRRWIYWCDFSLTWAVMLGLIVLGGWRITWFTPVALVVVALADFRLGSFIHEITHFRRGEFTSFVAAWNLLFGCPYGMPSPMFEYHLTHHALATYGTAADAEYFQLPRPFPTRGLGLLAVNVLVLPIKFVLRFTAGTLCLVFSPRYRSAVERKYSALHMLPQFAGPEWTAPVRRRWLVYELVAFAEITTVVALVAVGVIPITAILFAYLAAAGGHFVNQLRTLVVHGYDVRGSRSLSEQVHDSYDHPSRFGFLWGPLALGYHGTHHLLPRIPYHSVGRAHRRLMRSPDVGPALALSSQPGLIRSIEDLVSSDESIAVTP